MMPLASQHWIVRLSDCDWRLAIGSGCVWVITGGGVPITVVASRTPQAITHLNLDTFQLEQIFMFFRARMVSYCCCSREAFFLLGTSIEAS